MYINVYVHLKKGRGSIKIYNRFCVNLHDGTSKQKKKLICYELHYYVKF